MYALYYWHWLACNGKYICSLNLLSIFHCLYSSYIWILSFRNHVYYTGYGTVQCQQTFIYDSLVAATAYLYEHILLFCPFGKSNFCTHLSVNVRHRTSYRRLY